jgi:hypothetical protein
MPHTRRFSRMRNVAITQVTETSMRFAACGLRRESVAWPLKRPTTSKTSLHQAQNLIRIKGTPFFVGTAGEKRKYIAAGIRWSALEGTSRGLGLA